MGKYQIAVPLPSQAHQKVTPLECRPALGGTHTCPSAFASRLEKSKSSTTVQKSHLDKVLAAVSDLPILKGTKITSGAAHAQPPSGDSQIQGTTATLAGKLGGNTGPKLAVAAAAHLQLVNGKETFSREELLTSMRSATHYYKSSFGANLTATIDRLVRAGTFNETSKGHFTLTASRQDALRANLEQHK